MSRFDFSFFEQAHCAESRIQGRNGVTFVEREVGAITVGLATSADWHGLGEGRTGGQNEKHC